MSPSPSLRCSVWKLGMASIAALEFVGMNVSSICKSVMPSHGVVVTS